MQCLESQFESQEEESVNGGLENRSSIEPTCELTEKLIQFTTDMMEDTSGEHSAY